MVKLSQSPVNLTQIGSNLYELIKAHAITFYDDAEMRLAMSSQRCRRERERVEDQQGEVVA